MKAGEEQMSVAMEVSFDEAFEVVSDQGKKLQKRAYQSSGRYPVVDQGEEFIGGYTDAEELLIADPLPVIVFGDHTRRAKYVDFPFVVGAEGVKILRPRAVWKPKFVFHQIQSMDIEDRGYGRHF